MENHEYIIRGAKIHVEIYNPEGRTPLMLTVGGMGDCDGFRGYARNLVAGSKGELKVIIYDRRNLGRSDINYGTEPLPIEEAEDLHVLIGRLGVAPCTLFGMSSGGRSNLILIDRYPEDVACITIAPLTGGPIATARLSDEYYLKYVDDNSPLNMLGVPNSIEELSKWPLWTGYLGKNDEKTIDRFMNSDVAEFLAAMKRSGEWMQSYERDLIIGMTDEQLEKNNLPPLLVLHHGVKSCSYGNHM